MERHKVESQRERRILIALVVSSEFLAQAERVLDLELIDSELFRVVADWCLNYHRSYGKAPVQHVEDMFHKWSEDNENTDLVDSVKDFLESLGEEYEKAPELNVPYLLDQLRDFLAKRAIIRTKETVDYALSHGDVSEAEAALSSYRKVEVGQGTGFCPLGDRGAWQEAFAEPAKPLIRYEGPSGQFFNAALTRDALVGIQAPEKMGKTYFAIEFAVKALRQRRKVAFFEVGDLSKNQVMKRFGVRWAQRPLWKRQCGRIKVPLKITLDEAADPEYTFEHETFTVWKPLTREAAWQGSQSFMRGCGISSSYLRVSVHPTASISVHGISGILDQWEQEHDWCPDVCVIDYPDILAPEDSKKQARDQVNDTWKAMRRLSQERHILIIAPTQANALSYNNAEGAKLQTMGNFSEDKRKLAHCTGMFALNQTWAEKEMGGMRLNWIVLREAPYNSNRPLYVGTCFALGRAMCCSSFGG